MRFTVSVFKSDIDYRNCWTLVNVVEHSTKCVMCILFLADTKGGP